ncbi:uncharacterized protein LOC118188734 [Stegodyphus dumicola]|uniref:uncharacterized protein LOC118188734 n=1 Tax=Stegodyphus dumicola TaxID=202533 RepID=UPI0015AE9597|nr:uncharacterized protein LOC118188734 [Stegodyphus dumicola]
MILYGCQIWMTGTVRIQQKLQQIQRIILLKLTKAFTTTPTTALQVLAGTLPLDLKAEGERCIYRLTRGKQVHRILDTEIDDLCIKPISYTHSTHPAKVKNFNWTKTLPTGKSLEIFSDGSKIHDKVGVAFIALHNKEPLYKAAKRLSDHATVFQAESRALKDVALWAKQFNSIEINFYTDSMSVLQSLNKAGVIPVHIAALKEILATLGDSLHWIRRPPRHRRERICQQTSERGNGLPYSRLPHSTLRRCR